MILKKLFSNLKSINLQANILSQKEIISTIQELFPSPDQIMIEQLRQNPEDFYKNIKKEIYKVPTASLIKMTQKQFDHMQTWTLFQNEFQKRLKKMSLSDIAKISKNLALNNKTNYGLFRDISDEILARDEEIPFDDLEKFLFAFSHSNLGTPLLFTKFYSTLKLGQHEIYPVKISLYAKYFFKSQSIQKGKVYQISEKNILEYKDTLNFQDLLKITENLLPNNIGSNELQHQIEKLLLQKYVQPTFSQLVNLMKSTCQYRFQEQQLINKIYDDVEYNINYFSLEQLQNILWSVQKSKIQRRKLNQELKTIFIKNLKLLKPRGIAFAVEGFCKIGEFNDELLDLFRDNILENMDNFQAHYLYKIIKNIQNIDKDLTQSLISQLKDQVIKLNINEAISFLQILVDNDLQDDILDLFVQKFENQYKNMTTLQKSKIFVYFARLGKYIDLDVDANDVPKEIFCQYIFTLVNLKRWDQLLEFKPILENLQTFGNLKYFFSHDNFIQLVYSVMLLSQKESKQLLQSNFWSLTKEAMEEINPNTLQMNILRIYLQIVYMLHKFHQVDEQFYMNKIQEIDQTILDNYLQSDINYNINIELKQEIQNKIKQFEQFNNYQSIINHEFDFQTIIDIALINNENNFAIIIINQKHMIDDEQILGIYEMRYHNLQSQKWNIIFIVENEWKSFNDQEKTEYLQEHF